MVAMASKDKIKVKLFSRERVRRFFLLKREGSKQDLAEILAQRFPEELGFRLPPKRRPWMSEDYRMQIFDAVALAIVGSMAGLRRGAHVSR